MQKQTGGKKSVKANLIKFVFVTMLAMGSLMPLAVSADADPTPTPAPKPQPSLSPPAQTQVSWNS